MTSIGFLSCLDSPSVKAGAIGAVLDVVEVLSVVHAPVNAVVQATISRSRRICATARSSV